MPVAAPLQFLLFRHSADEDVVPYEEAIVRAFQGGKEAGDYLASGEDLGIQLEVFATAPKDTPQTTLDSFSHTVTVVLIDRELLEKSEDALWDWLSGCWDITRQSNGRHAMVA